jgi:protein-S-isoprenylcysteine O-methyltransferase Ste14
MMPPITGAGVLDMEQNNSDGNMSILSALAESSFKGIRLAFTNFLLATFYVFFAYTNAHSFIGNPRLSVLLIVVAETIAAIFLIVRRDPDETWHSWQTWLTTTCGTLAPLLLRPVAAAEDLLVGEVLIVFGVAMQIFALAALNRSFGLLPALRGVKSRGLYRLVRHPLYAAYVIIYCGYLINNQSISNGTIVLLGIAFLVMRIHYEETLLSKQADYRRYLNKTRWRLIPAIW